MSILRQIIDIFLHIDTHLQLVIANYGVAVYIILFLIIFCETGLVVFPFLPGDSLLFASGAFAAISELNIWLIIPLLLVAAILGDTLNYWIGHKLGNKVLNMKSSFFFKPEHAAKAQQFYDKYGGKAIIIARFIPIVRTFAPFVAGVGKMHYRNFLIYNIVGAILWVFSFVGAGYFFGNLPFVKNNFTNIVFAIIAVSLVPAVVQFIKGKIKKDAAMTN